MAFWATPSYEAKPWTLLGVLRYEDDARAADDDGVDWGGRAIFSAENYAFSLEYVERVPIDATPALSRSHRLVGIAEYRVTSGTWLVASFGKDRQKTSTPLGTLVAQLGLAFNFSKERYKF